MTSVEHRPATYREVFALGEFRALFSAYVLSLAGDWLAKVALAVLVFDRTRSPLLTAVAFGIGYLPYVVGGPVLSALADRLPRRAVMVFCDLVRAGLVALLAVPGLPLWLLLVVLFITELFAPPFVSARSAMMPDILEGDRYVIGTSITHMADQGAQVLGYALGGVAVAVLSARGSLLLDAGTFVLSAVLLLLFVRNRPAAAQPDEGGSLLHDTVEGIRFVFGSRVLLAYALMAWLGSAVAAGPEGLAPPYARHLGGQAVTVGLYLAANPFGYFVGALVIGRFVTPEWRRRLVRPLALLICLALLLVALDPSLPVLLGLLAIAGFGLSFNLALNQMFVQAVPARLRGRAFGVAASGLMIFQGLATFLGGAVANTVPMPYVVAGFGLVGLVVVGLVSLRWPTEEEMAQPVAAPTREVVLDEPVGEAVGGAEAARAPLRE